MATCFQDREVPVIRQIIYCANISVSETGLQLEHLQEIYYIPLDIFKQNLENKGIRTELDMWLTFLSSNNPERIMELIEKEPWFRNLYEDIYQICLNTERVMEMYSKELDELDRNTTLYMIDHMKKEIDEKDAQIERFTKEKELAKRLLKDGRIEDIERMNENPEVIEQLMKEYFEE